MSQTGVASCRKETDLRVIREPCLERTGGTMGCNAGMPGSLVGMVSERTVRRAAETGYAFVGTVCWEREILMSGMKICDGSLQQHLSSKEPCFWVAALISFLSFFSFVCRFFRSARAIYREGRDYGPWMDLVDHVFFLLSEPCNPPAAIGLFRVRASQ